MDFSYTYLSGPHMDSLSQGELGSLVTEAFKAWGVCMRKSEDIF